MLSKPLSPPEVILSGILKKFPGNKTPPDKILTVPPRLTIKRRLVPSPAFTMSTGELNPDVTTGLKIKTGVVCAMVFETNKKGTAVTKNSTTIFFLVVFIYSSYKGQRIYRLAIGLAQIQCQRVGCPVDNIKRQFYFKEKFINFIIPAQKAILIQ